MEIDWSVAAAADDLVIELPWRDEASGLAWVDLRVNAELQRSRIAALPEAAASPVLARCLALLNAPGGLLLTTKCDYWRLSDEERGELADALDESVAAYGFGSYIDVLMVHATPRADFLLHEEWARLTARRCAALPAESARMELIVRPAHSHGAWGYGVTLYCYAGGANEKHAQTAWASALEQVGAVLITSADSLFASPGESNPDRRLS